MTITTNNVPRPVIDGWELSPAQRQEFDYINWDGLDAGTDIGSTFFSYRGELYDLNDAQRWTATPDSPLADWHGFYGETYFSAVVFRYVDNGDGDDFGHVVVGHWSE